MRLCNKCGNQKPESGFNYRNRSKGILKRQCKSCDSEQFKELYYSSNSQKKQIEARSIGIKSKICSNCRIEKSFEDFPALSSGTFGLHTFCRSCRLIKQNAKLYSLSEQEYELLLESRNGVCDSCGSQNVDGSRLSIDHDHSCCEYGGSCGRCIRGLLCRNCNLAEGFLRNYENARRLAEYMKRTGR